VGLLVVSAGLFSAFIAIEARVANPLVPLRLFRSRNLATANVVGALWAASMFGWMFISALYLQLVMGYSAIQVGLAFLPTNIIMAVFSPGLLAKLVLRFGLKPPLVAGLLIAALGLALFARGQRRVRVGHTARHAAAGSGGRHCLQPRAAGCDERCATR
jgi:hypothetical protein